METKAEKAQDAAEDADLKQEQEQEKKPAERVIVSVIGEHVLPVERVDGANEPTRDPRCQDEACGGPMRETGRTQNTASAGTLSTLQCADCGATSYWRDVKAWEYVGDNLQF